MSLNGRAINLVVTSTILVSLATTAVVLRFTARQRRHLPYKKDDWLSLVGQILLFAMLIEAIIWIAIGGAGEHWSHLSAQTRVQFFKIFYANQITYIVLTPVIKLAVISFYQRVFDTKKFRLITNILMGIISLYFLGHFIFAMGFSCRPIRKAWDPTAAGVCAAPIPQIVSFQAANIVFDFIILALPVPMCWNLHRPWQDRAAILTVFLVGAFVCAASVARLDTLMKIDHSDISYSIYDACIWTLVEPCIGQVCGCLPVARGLFPAWTTGRPYTPHTRSSSTNSGKHSHASPSIRFIKSFEQLFSHHDEETTTHRAQSVQYFKPDDKPLVTNRSDAEDGVSSFELRRSNSTKSKVSVRSKDTAVTEAEMV